MENREKRKRAAQIRGFVRLDHFGSKDRLRAADVGVRCLEVQIAVSSFATT
jgi:hypothetical protein